MAAFFTALWPNRPIYVDTEITTRVIVVLSSSSMFHDINMISKLRVMHSPQCWKLDLYTKYQAYLVQFFLIS